MGGSPLGQVVPDLRDFIHLGVRKALGEIALSEAKNLEKPLSNKQPVDHAAQNAPRHHIVNVIYHHDATLSGFESVFMVPEREWPDALLIDKTTQFLDMLDLGQPAHRNPKDRANSIFDHETGMNHFGDITQDFKIQKRGRHGLQIFWRCKKLPCFIEANRKKLRLMDAMNFQD